MMGIERGLNRIINCSKRRNYVISRLINSGYTVVFILVCIMSLVLMVFGTSLQRLLLRYLPILEHIAPYLLSIRALIALAILIVFFMGLYTFLPFESWSFSDSGALFSTAGWIVCSYGFSIYFNHFKRFSYMYGDLAAIVILMLWLYFCICILFLGAEVNQHMHFGENHDNACPGCLTGQWYVKTDIVPSGAAAPFLVFLSGILVRYSWYAIPALTDISPADIQYNIWGEILAKSRPSESACCLSVSRTDESFSLRYFPDCFQLAFPKQFFHIHLLFHGVW